MPSLTRRVARRWSRSWRSSPGSPDPIAYSLDTASTGKCGVDRLGRPVGRVRARRRIRRSAAPGGQGRAARRRPVRPARHGRSGRRHRRRPRRRWRPGGAGGLLQGSTPSSALVTLLEQNSGSYTWVAAAIGSNEASGYQLASGKPVMPIGGFNGSDPSPTLAQFQRYVSPGKDPLLPRRRTWRFRRPLDGWEQRQSAIAAWVQSHYTAPTVDGVTVYDLTQPPPADPEPASG